MKLKICLFVLMCISYLTAQEPFYGVQTHFGQFYRADMDSAAVIEQLELCREAGIEIIRDECLWMDVERDSGVFAIPYQVDFYVQEALSRGIDIYMILNYNNTIYAPNAGSGVVTEANRIAYARYCQFLVGHFAPMGVKHFEIWNEPNHGVLFWTPEPDPDDYFAMLQTAYEAIKAIDSSVIVIGCATSPAIGNPYPFIEGLDFIRDVFSAGGASFMDAVSFHLYQVAYRPEYELFSYVDKVRSFVGDMPIYFSEFGYPTHTGWPNISLSTQAMYVSRMFLSCLLDPQIKTAIYYDLKNDGTNPAEPEHHFGLLEFNRDPKPAYHALKTLIGRSGAARPISSETANDRFILTFSDSLTIAWSYTGEKGISITSSAPAVRVDNYLGTTIAFHIPAEGTISVRVNEGPRYYISQSEPPVLGGFSFKYHALLMYPGESITPAFSAHTEEDIPVIIEAGALSWEYVGSGGSVEGHVFTANGSPGTGFLIADIFGLRDSILVTVMEDPGIHTLETFEDTAGFSLVSSQLDMSASGLSTEHIDGRDVLRLHYKYEGSSAAVYLNKPILFNHLADSIFMTVKTDEKTFEFRLNCRDATGRTYTMLMQPRPADWGPSWGTMRVPVGINPTPPVQVEKIYIIMKPGETTQTAPYTGELLFDRMVMTRGAAYSSLRDIVPSSIRLSQNYPNPFNDDCFIDFYLSEETPVRLDIISLKGEVIATPLRDHRPAGEHRLLLQMNSLPSGIYLYRLATPKATVSRKLVYLK